MESNERFPHATGSVFSVSELVGNESINKEVGNDIPIMTSDLDRGIKSDNHHVNSDSISQYLCFLASLRGQFR